VRSVRSVTSENGATRGKAAITKSEVDCQFEDEYKC